MIRQISKAELWRALTGALKEVHEPNFRLTPGQARGILDGIDAEEDYEEDVIVVPIPPKSRRRVMVRIVEVRRGRPSRA